MLENLETQELIIRCIQQDKKACKELYYLYAQKIYGTCRRYSSDDHQAKDFMQEAFIRIFAKLDKYDNKKGNFQAWMTRVCINCILSEKRKKQIARVYDEIDITSDNHMDLVYEDEIIDHEMQKKELLYAIRQLPTGMKEVLNLFVFEDWSHQEIAKFLGIKESSSRSRFSRAKNLLKKNLKNQLSIAYEQ